MAQRRRGEEPDAADGPVVQGEDARLQELLRLRRVPQRADRDPHRLRRRAPPPAAALARPRNPRLTGDSCTCTPLRAGTWRGSETPPARTYAAGFRTACILSLWMTPAPVVRSGEADPVDPAVALAQLGGDGRPRRVAGAGHPSQARDALASGSVVRLPRRQVALPSLDSGRQAAASVGGTISHLSAALEHGWKVKAPPPCPTLTVPRNRRLPAGLPKLELHWARFAARRRGQRCDHSPADGRRLQSCLPARRKPRCRGLGIAFGPGRPGPVARRRSLVTTDRPHQSRLRRAPRVRTRGQPVRIGAARDRSHGPRPAGQAPGLGRGCRARGSGRRPPADRDRGRFMGAPRHPRGIQARRTPLCEFARLGWVVVRFLWEDVMHQPDRVRRHLAQVAAVRAHQVGANAGSSQIQPARGA